MRAVFHETLVDHPGWVLWVEDLSNLTNGQLSNSRVIAGALSGYVNWCERLNRRFPFYWVGSPQQRIRQVRNAAMGRPGFRRGASDPTTLLPASFLAILATGAD